MQFKKAAAVLVGAALLMGGLAAAAPAAAEPVTYDSWIEDGDATPFATTDGLVFYQNASINFGQKDGDALKDLVPLAEVSGLAYTVEDSTSYAPSYQLGIVSAAKKVTYARLVWEPYQQATSPGDKKGTYTDLEKGQWWGRNVYTASSPTIPTTPFGSGDGSQSKPMSLDFFKDYFGADAQIAFFGVKQGSTSAFVSTVTSLTFEGQKVPLGNPDASPYSAKDVSDKVKEATTPLQSQLTTEKAATASLNNQLAAAKAALTQSASAALAKLTAAQNDAKTAQAKLVTISGTKGVGHKVTAKFAKAVPGAKVKYQWYASDRTIKGATKASLKLTNSQRARTLSVKVTTSWTDAAGKARSVSVTVKYLHAAYVGR